MQHALVHAKSSLTQYLLLTTISLFCCMVNQQREANHRASESEAERQQHLAANQQREANRRASE